MDNVKDELRRFVIDNYYFGRDGRLRDSDSFLEQGIIDSTGILELISFLEEKFSIQIESEELIPENLDSINQVADFVVKKTARREALAAS